MGYFSAAERTDYTAVASSYLVAATDDDLLLTAPDSGKLKRSTNHGETFADVGTDEGQWYLLAMSADGRYCYASLRSDASVFNVYRSADYGATWAAVQASAGAFTSGGLACSSDGSIVYATAQVGGTNSVYRSDDYGASYDAVGSSWAGIFDLHGSLACSGDGTIVYLCAHGGDAYEVRKSTNSGVDFTAVLTGKFSLRCSADGQTVVAFSIAGEMAGQPKTSQDGGANWAYPSGLIEWHVGDAAMTPSGRVVIFSQGYDLRVSLDYGASFATIEDPAPEGCMVALSGGGRVLYAAETDNLYRYHDADVPADTEWTGSITIEGGAENTTKPTPTLTLAATSTAGAVEDMSFSDDGSNWGAWEPYATSASHALTAGAGAKIVYVRFRDENGNLSPTYSDGITYAVAVWSGCSLSINAGAASTADNDVTLTIAAVDQYGDPPDEMRLAEDAADADPDSVVWGAWEAYATTKAWQLAAQTDDAAHARGVGVEFRNTE